jgi:hypothetical protein
MWGWDTITRGLLEFRVLKNEKSQACWLHAVWPGRPASPAHRVNADWLALWPTWDGRWDWMPDWHRLRVPWPGRPPASSAANRRQRARLLRAAAAAPPLLPRRIGCNWPAAASPVTAANKVNRQWVVEAQGPPDSPHHRLSSLAVWVLPAFESYPPLLPVQPARWIDSDWLALQVVHRQTNLTKGCAAGTRCLRYLLLVFRFKIQVWKRRWSLADCGSGSMCHLIYCILSKFDSTWTCQWCVTHCDR